MTTTTQTESESDITDEPAEEARPRPAWWVKLIAFGACLLTLWHVGASFLWIAPYSALREIPTQEVLAGYMLPMFGQSWSVFAPEP
ncbi:DUF5819 family protein, partial [Microbacterium sp. SZ1]|uniref:DUF5819 family protein n=1 Tax=Microbacterium sp. SZ1 TaxID=1849736 RepID=UPI00211C630F